MKANAYTDTMYDYSVLLPDKIILEYLEARKNAYDYYRFKKLYELHGSKCWWSDASEEHQQEAHEYAVRMLNASDLTQEYKYAIARKTAKLRKEAVPM